MRQFSLSMAFALGLCFGVSRFGASDEPSPATWHPLQAWSCPSALLSGCCDDYDAKPLPCPRDLCYGCRQDDYCMKPFPWIPCFPGCRLADCYCSKPCPELCRPLSPHFFSCDAGGTCCAVRLKALAQGSLSVGVTGISGHRTGRPENPSLPSVSHPVAFGTEKAKAVN
jgi:hypothetical protein